MECAGQIMPGATNFIPVTPGVQLRLIAGAAAGSRSLGTVVIATGRSEFCEKYIDCANVLRAMTYNTVIFDWRGQGLSSRTLRERQKGHVGSYDEYIEDLEHVIEFATKLYGDRAIYVVAHSMGAHIALRTMALRPEKIRAAILTAPMIDITHSQLQFRLFDSLSFVAVMCGIGEAYVLGRGGYGNHDRDFSHNVLTHDPERFALEHDAIAANSDLALGGPSWGWLRATITSIKRLRAEAATGRITTNILIVSAGDDRVVSNRAQTDIRQSLPNAELISIPASYHEILQETPPIRAAFWELARAFLARDACGIR